MRPNVAQPVDDNIGNDVLEYQSLRFQRDHRTQWADLLRERYGESPDVGADIDSDITGVEQPEQKRQLHFGPLAKLIEAFADHVVRMEDERAVSGDLIRQHVDRLAGKGTGKTAVAITTSLGMQICSGISIHPAGLRDRSGG